MDERIWRLPGPRGLVREALSEYGRRRNVAIVLPRALAAQGELTDSLAVELISGIDHSVYARRVFPDGDTGTLVETIGRAVVYDDYPPVTLPDLLRHDDAAHCVAVVVATDLPDDQQKQFPELLRRLEIESRSAPHSQRLTLLAVVSRDHLPQFAGGETTDVSLATVWWWNRVTRWDAAAYTAELDCLERESRVLADVRAETIVEVARWDLDLAESLVTSWSGDPSTLHEALSSVLIEVTTSAGAVRHCGSRPGESVIEHWDDHKVDGWHDTHAFTAHALATAPEQLARLVWAAQARLLLPWIEERRAVLCNQIEAFMGHRRYRAALGDLFTPPLTNADLIEVGSLRKIVEIRIGSANPALRSASRRLHDARNRLAHLRPLSLAELRELVAACDRLT